MMSDVVKAGVLEVTVVQAVGVDLLGTTSALSRTRRKPALVARVTVDGTTKSGQPAQRSHHPVWFPAQPPSNSNSNPCDNNNNNNNNNNDTASLSSNSYSREGGVSSARNSFSNSNSSVFSRAGINANPADGVDSAGGSLDQTRARYGGWAESAGRTSSGGRGRGGMGGRGSIVDHSGDVGRSNGNSGGSSNIARGLLFEVREFYGPTRIVVELVPSGGGGGGGGGGGTGAGGGGGTVSGACEARLAEALVGRGGGYESSSTSSFKPQRVSNFGLGNAARTLYGPPPVTVSSSPGDETRQSPPSPREEHSHNNADDGGEAQPEAGAGAAHPSVAMAPSHSLAGAGRGQEAERDRDRDRDQDRDQDQDQDQPGSPARDASGARSAPNADSTTAAAATANAAPAPAPAQCAGCLPGGGIFGRWRRSRGARHQSSPDGGRGGNPAVAGGATGSGDGGGGGSARKAGESGSGAGTGKEPKTGGGGGGTGSKKNASSGGVVGGMTAVRSVAAKAVAAGGSSRPGAITLEEAERLATSDWGGGVGTAANGAARDFWKPLVHVGGGGKGGKGKVKESGASGGGSGLGPAGPAVRLRLRFIPLWDCLSDGGAVNGLGALHAAARDGDARLVTSLVHLWQSLSPGSQVLSLPCRRGLTPIQHCIEAGKESALRELLRGIAKDSLRCGGGGSGEEGGDTPLHTAVKAGEEGMLKMLLDQTRRAEMNPSRIVTALRFGLGSSPNTSVDALGSDGLTPLALSALCGNESMVRCLLNEGANAASADARGMTPIAYAAHGGHLLAVRALLEAKATGGPGSGVPGLRRSKLARLRCAPCKTNEDGMGPVALAAASGSAEVVSELLRSGIPYRTRDRDGRTPLHLAAQSGHVPVLRVLDVVVPRGDNTWMMDGGPFRLRNLDLYGRTAHATALQHNHPQAAAFLEAAAEELEPQKPKTHGQGHGNGEGPRSITSKRRGGGAGSMDSSGCVVVAPGGTAKEGHPPRSSAASSPTLGLAQRSGSGCSGGSSSSSSSSSSAQESSSGGASGRQSPVSSISGGLGSAAGSVLESCNSYECGQQPPRKQELWIGETGTGDDKTTTPVTWYTNIIVVEGGPSPSTSSPQSQRRAARRLAQLTKRRRAGSSTSSLARRLAHQTDQRMAMPPATTTANSTATRDNGDDARRRQRQARKEAPVPAGYLGTARPPERNTRRAATTPASKATSTTTPEPPPTLKPTATISSPATATATTPTAWIDVGGERHDNSNGDGKASVKFCEGELGTAPWACETLSPVNPDVYSSAWKPVPNAAPGNPVTYQQVAGEPAFDVTTGERNGNAAVFVLTEGYYQCIVAESKSEAALFDAPEGSFTSSTTPFPSSSWLPESIKALLAEGTKLKYLVFSHAHWDHIGGMGLVAEYFADDEPLAVSSRRVRRSLKKKDQNDPASSFGNTRGVPVPQWYQEDVLEVGRLRFKLEKIHIHMSGDYAIFLDKHDEANAAEGINASVLMVVDAILPGWSPFFAFAVAENLQEYYQGLEEVIGYDFDVFVGGHITRLGTKQDVQLQRDYAADILKGAELGIASVSATNVFAGTGIADPASPNAGNWMLLFNELYERVVDVCYDFVLDSSARSYDWRAVLSGVEPTLRSHCWVVQQAVRIG
eukprot:g18011.t1